MALPQHIAQMERLFTSHVPKGKVFDPSKITVDTRPNGPHYVWGCIVPSSPKLLMRYSFDGVEIVYHRRVTTRLGDTDEFTDITVTVDEKVEYEYKQT